MSRMNSIFALDYCRAGETAPNDPNIFCSGGYDNMVNVLDLRSQEITMSFNHGAPVESICLFPSMSLIVSSGGPTIKVWDCYQRKLLTQLSNHTKTVTSVCLSHDNTKIISAGLDKRVNVFDALDYSTVSTFESDSPILSMSLSQRDSTMALGMAGGFISVAQRSTKTTIEDVTKDSKKMKMYKPSRKSEIEKSNRPDGEVIHKTKKYENIYNKLFRKFEYNRVLTMALSTNIRRKRPEVLVAVLQELIRRKCIDKVLTGRKETEVCSLLRFIGRNFADMNWQPVLIEVLGILIENYQDRISKSEQLHRLFKLINSKLSQEMKLIGECYKCIGMIDSLKSRSASILPDSQPILT